MRKYAEQLLFPESWSQMISSDAMRKGAGYAAVCAVMALLLHACGGGGSSHGQSGATTPTGGVPTPGPTFVVPQGGDIGKVINKAPPGSTVFVAAGQYAPISLGAPVRAITLVADVSGEWTTSGLQGAVTINGGGASPAIQLSNTSDVVIQGFTAIGGLNAGIRVSNSPGTIVRNCIVDGGGNHTDGIRLEKSNGSLIFNNLVFDNNGAGISLLGAANVQMINNTIAQNALGISIGDNALPSGNIVVENSIFYGNTQAAISATGSTGAFSSDYNLYNGNAENLVGVTAGAHDVPAPHDPPADPQFRFPLQGGGQEKGFYLNATSPAVDAGDPNTDVSIPNTDFTIVDVLTSCGGGGGYGAPGCGEPEIDLTTQVDSTLDSEPVDMGYHYPIVFLQPTPTPVPR